MHKFLCFYFDTIYIKYEYFWILFLTFRFECEVLINLLTAQICMTDCSFMQALLHLSTAHARLNANASAAPPKEVGVHGHM